MIPAPGPTRPLRAPRVAEAKLRNGLRVLVVRKPTVPRVEMRLIVPAAGKRDRATSSLLGRTITAGTIRRSAADIARDLQRLGGSLSAGMGADDLQLSGSVLSASLGSYLELTAEVLADASFPQEEIAVERQRAIQQTTMARSQPQTVAQEALLKRLYGKHPYGFGLPEPEALARVGRAAVHRLYSEVVVPREGLLILVGDIQPQKAIDVVSSLMSGWKGKASASAATSPPPPRPGNWIVVDRPGSVQSNVRLAGEIPPPGASDAAALDVANTIFGGYFISRFVENLRERNGYTYSPHSGLVHRRLASFLQIAADVGTEVTAPSVVETMYELGRMVALPVTDEELVSAQRYVTGIMSIRIQSQAGLASTLAGLLVHKLGVEHLRTYPREIEAVTVADVQEASRRYLAPSRLVAVVVGDAEQIAPGLETLEPVEVAST